MDHLRCRVYRYSNSLREFDSSQLVEPTPRCQRYDTRLVRAAPTDLDGRIGLQACACVPCVDEMAPAKQQQQQSSTRRIASTLSHVNPAAADVETERQSEAALTVREPDDSLYDAHVAEVAVQDQLPVVILDMVLPRQRVNIAVSNVTQTQI